jgi:hypothetical protein
MTAWTDAVSAEFKEGRKTNPNFSLKQAMMKAKKTYKKGKTAKMRGGKSAELSPALVENNKAPVPPVMKGGKKNKSTKKNKSSKRGKK